jgi:hypothetical protein
LPTRASSSSRGAEAEGGQKGVLGLFQDTPNHFQNAVDYFGLIRRDFSRKPSFDTYKELVQTDNRRFL